MQQWAMFDLDGTLIDSSPSILASYQAVLKDAGIAPVVPLSDALIGPPLRQTLMKITGFAAGEEVEKLARRFQEVYDSTGFLETRVYPGVEEMLSGLASAGINMAIATNKRRNPTVKILEHLGWQPYFRSVGTLDTPAVPHADKAAMIASLLADCKAEGARTPYLGDTWADGMAASTNGMPFLAAGWGYGEWPRESLPEGWTLIEAPEDFFGKVTG